MEILSQNYTTSLAAVQSYSFDKPDKDHGIDLVLRKIARRSSVKGSRVFATTQGIYVQLKSTTEKGIIVYEDRGYLSYSLNTDNYNDLIRNRRSIHTNPMILILFIFPEDRQVWLELGDSFLTKRKHAYWWEPGQDDTETANVGTKNIHIPLVNRINLHSFDKILVS